MFLATLTLAVLSNPAPPAGLEDPRLLHALHAEAPYGGTPIYALFLFGAPDPTPVWAVVARSLDGERERDLLYLDLNADGDLSDPAERFPLPAEPGRRGAFVLSDLRIPGIPSPLAEFVLRTQWPAEDLGVYFELTWSDGPTLRGAYGPDGERYARFEADPSRAPVFRVPLDPPLSFVRFGSGRLKAGESTSVRLVAGSMGEGATSLVSVPHTTLDPAIDRVFVTLVARDGQGAELRSRTEFVSRAPPDFLVGRVSVPEEAASGPAELVVELESSRGRTALPSTIPVVLSRWDLQPDQGTFLAQGSIRILEPAGTWTDDANGTFEALLWTQSSRNRFLSEPLGSSVIRVENGRWSMEAPEGSWLEMGKLELEGGVVLLPDHADDGFELVQDEDLVVDAHRARDVRIHVTELGHEGELKDCVLVPRDDWETDSMHRPVLAAGAVDGLRGDSPLLLSETTDSSGGREFWLGARGYAWRPVSVFTRTGGDYHFELQRSAALEVTIPEGLEVPGDAVLRFWKVGFMGTLGRLFGQDPEFFDAVYTEAAVPAKSTRIEGLEPGNYVVKIEVGHFWDDELRTYAQGSASTTTGVIGRCQLEPVAQPDPLRPGVLSGTFSIHPDWEDREWVLRAEPGDRDFGPFGRGPGPPAEGSRELRREDCTPVPDRERSWRWSFGEVEAGPWTVSLDAWSVFETTTVDGPETEALRLRVPAPVLLLVEVIDADSGTPAEDLTISASGEDLQPSGVGQFSLRLPARSIWLQVESKRYTEDFEALLLRAPVTRHTLRVHRKCGIEVCFVENGVEVPVGFEVSVDVVPVDRSGLLDGTSYSWGGDQSGITVHVARPGDYRLLTSKLPGYEPVPAMEVTVPIGDYVRVEVPMVRQKRKDG